MLVQRVVPKPDPKFGNYGNSVTQKLLAMGSVSFKWATVCAKVGPQEILSLPSQTEVVPTTLQLYVYVYISVINTLHYTSTTC